MWYAGEITQLSLQSIPTQEPDTQQAATSREEGNSTVPQIKSRKTFSFRPHRAPSSQQLSAHEVYITCTTKQNDTHIL